MICINIEFAGEGYRGLANASPIPVPYSIGFQNFYMWKGRLFIFKLLDNAYLKFGLIMLVWALLLMVWSLATGHGNR